MKHEKGKAQTTKDEAVVTKIMKERLEKGLKKELESEKVRKKVRKNYANIRTILDPTLASSWLPLGDGSISISMCSCFGPHSTTAIDGTRSSSLTLLPFWSTLRDSSIPALLGGLAGSVEALLPLALLPESLGLLLLPCTAAAAVSPRGTLGLSSPTAPFWDGARRGTLVGPALRGLVLLVR